MQNAFRSNEMRPSWYPMMQETQQRWFIFLQKLEERADVLCEAAIPELQAVFRDDEDIYKRAHGRMLAGLEGQLDVMRTKASDVREEKIEDFFDEHRGDEDGFDALLVDFRSACFAREDVFEQHLAQCKQRLQQAARRDYEAEYRQIVAEFEASRERFCCSQCGGPIRIERLFFLTTYVTCPSCQTRSTFEPSSQARQLEMIGRNLAEQRCTSMLDEYEAERKKERDLYHQIHENRELFGDGEEVRQAKAARNHVLAHARQDAIAKAPALYEKYLRAMFDEWNKIVPDLAEHNERFYQRMLNDFRRML